MLIYIGIAFLCFSSILLRNCVMVARMTLDHTVWVRVLVPQPVISRKIDLDIFLSYRYINQNAFDFTNSISVFAVVYARQVTVSAAP